MPAAEQLNRGKTPRFLLSKWYLDCVADNGDGVVVYVAELRWSSWRTRYASTLRFFGDKTESASSIRKCVLPESSRDQITLSLPHLGIEGSWKGFAAPIERTIFERSDGAVRWHCLQPGSQVQLSLDRSLKMSGLGYAELVEISIPPWRLPLSELHWGRFVSESDTVVWIDWRGTHCHRLAVHNDSEREIAAITTEEVRSADSETHLTFDRGLVLRSGTLGETVFPTLARLARAIPAKMLGVHERKWRSRGVLRTEGRTAEAWAIHEVVKWGGE
jgi:hypothetical protein